MIVAGNDPLACIAWLGCARLGAVVSLLNPGYAPAELGDAITRLRPALVLADAEHEHACRAVTARAGLAVAPLQAVALAAGEPFTGSHPAPTAAHEISFTSGTTSRPKGVVLSHGTLLARARAEIAALQLGPADTGMVITPLFHQSGIRNTVLATWLAGGHAVVAPRFDRHRFWSWVARFSVTYLCLVETILTLLEQLPVTPEEDANTLRCAIGSGDPATMERCEARFGLQLLTAYGMTECGVATAVPVGTARKQLERLRRATGGVLAGWPLGDTEVRLVDSGEVLTGTEACGEIQLRSSFLLERYFEDEAATAAAFDDGWFRTGDLGRRGADGTLYYLDRLKDIIRRGGENVSARQVEEVIARHPAVGEVAVIAVPDPVFVQEIMAVIVPAAGAESPSPDALWTLCDGALARFKVPRYLAFTSILPKTPSQRIQKSMLRNMTDTFTSTHDRRAGKGQA